MNAPLSGAGEPTVEQLKTRVQRATIVESQMRDAVRRPRRADRKAAAKQELAEARKELTTAKKALAEAKKAVVKTPVTQAERLLEVNICSDGGKDNDIRKEHLTVAPHYGATPEEWQAAIDGRHTAHMLPIVSRPDAPIWPKSSLFPKPGQPAKLGKVPSIFNSKRLVVGFTDWVPHVASEAQVRAWAKEPDYGFGLNCLVVRAFDIDVENAALVAAIRAAIYEITEQLPVRVRNGSGRCLLAYRREGQQTKHVIPVAGGGVIEMLADNQQFVAVGTHPSGYRYEWMGADDSFGLPALDDIPMLTGEQVAAVQAMLEERFKDKDAVSQTSKASAVLDKPRRAADINDRLYDALNAKGAFTDVTPDGKAILGRCPGADTHTNDTDGSSSTVYLGKGLGGVDHRALHCMHASCQGKPLLRMLAEQHDVLDVLEACEQAEGRGSASPDEFEIVPVDPTALVPPEYERDAKTNLKNSTANYVLALHRPDQCGYRLGFDKFTGELMIAPEHAADWMPFTDKHYALLRIGLNKRVGLKEPTKDMMRDVLLLIADENAFDSAIDWSNTLDWDGVERIETFLIDYFGVADTPYARAVALYLWTALAARLLEPAHKCDMVVVLVGPQGGGKTSAVEAIAPTDETFVEINLERKDDDLSRSLRGKLVGELAELRGLQGRDAEGIKAWITKRFEEWIPKFLESKRRFDRRVVFIGTTNNTRFLADDTGERRWLPVKVGTVDVAGIRAMRDLLWGEAIARFRHDGLLWQEAQELAKAEHEAYKVRDVWTDSVQTWLAADSMGEHEGTPRGQLPFKVSDVLAGLSKPAGAQTNADAKRIGSVLRGLGYVASEKRVAGVKAMWWEVSR